MDAFVPISGLVHLKEIKLVSFIIDCTIDVPVQPMPSVQTLHLVSFELRGAEPIGATFGRIFSTMFPCLRKLYIEGEVARTKTDIKSHLFLFGKQCKYHFL